MTLPWPHCRRPIVGILFLGLLLLVSQGAQAVLPVVTTTADLQNLVEAVDGSRGKEVLTSSRNSAYVRV